MNIFRRLLGLLNRLLTYPYRLARRKISVQLVYSHVLVVILTVIVIQVVGAAVFLGLSRWGSIGLDEPNWDLGSDARILAAPLGAYEAFESNDSDLTADQRAAIELAVNRLISDPVSDTFPGSVTDIEAALVTDAEGQIIASSDADWAASEQSASSIESTLVASTTARAVELRGGATGHENTWLLDWDGNHTVASHPIMNNQGEFSGVVTLQSRSFSEVADAISRDMVMGFLTANLVVLAAVTVPAFLTSLPVGIWTARAFARRLSAIDQAADAMSHGNLSRRVEVKGHDEISRLSERFNEMAERLADVDRSRRSFVANVSHELRTPIAIIEGHVESLVNAGAENRSLAVIQQEARTLERLIDDLFTLARIEEGVLPVTIGPVGVLDVVNESVEGMKTVAWEQRKVTVQSLVSPGIPAVLADRTRLRQILGNLLYNALRHTTEGGLVIVNASRINGEVELSVTDTGLGISEDEMGRVFDRFYQTERAARNREGSGLGLSIVKQLVEAQGGTISVTSVVGEGTTFRFRLPVA